MIRMMTSKEEFERNPENVEVVTDYSGAEVGRVHHSRTCPHHGKHDLSGALTPECVTDGEYFSDRCDVNMRPLYMRTSHVGLVLSLRERNGYDDSDFFALVWNPEKGAPESIEYASTRGWTYPNHATVDATPEVRAAYEAYEANRRDAANKLRAEREARVPKVGRTVKVIKGRKIPQGTIAEVVWFGRNAYARDYASKYAIGMLGRDLLSEVESGLHRVGLMINGERMFTDARNVEVVS